MQKKRILLVLWTTGRCNLKCRYCYAGSEHLKEDMTFATAAKAIDYFSDCLIKIQFAGGEPLLNYSLICKIVDYVKEKGYDATFQMQTNGMLIDEKMAAEIKRMKISIGISMDGPPEINEETRGKTKAVINGIHCLGQAGVMINLNAVVTNYNVDALPELLKYALYFGNVAGIGLDLLREAGRAKDKSSGFKKAEPEKLKQALIKMQKQSDLLYQISGRSIVIREIEEAKKRLGSKTVSKDYCYAACGLSFVILPKGDVYPCGSLIDNPDYYMGNIIKGPLRTLAIKSGVMAACKQCDYVLICPGGCPSRMIINRSGMLEEPLDCVLKKTAFEIVKNRK